jgi:hypothetical protein
MEFVRAHSTTLAFAVGVVVVAGVLYYLNCKIDALARAVLSSPQPAAYQPQPAAYQPPPPPTRQVTPRHVEPLRRQPQPVQPPPQPAQPVYTTAYEEDEEFAADAELDHILDLELADLGALKNEPEAREEAQDTQ